MVDSVSYVTERSRAGHWATPIPAATSAAPATAAAVIASSRRSAPNASAPNGMRSEMNDVVTAGSSRSSTVSVTNVNAVPSADR
jgi:hypothetical protein